MLFKKGLPARHASQGDAGGWRGGGLFEKHVPLTH
ncbi:MAG: hypothetical protein G01um101470_815 [Parcubacteria group bacterium Gr01-1014_70]|nr:MAG: hypothetical protein G01um101470_815 [Parcubacteria group bacterium Gr01-1014_70]